MNKFLKIMIFSSIIIFGTGAILLNQDMGIKENIYVVSESEGETTDTPKNIKQDVDKESIKVLDKDNTNEKKIDTKNMITIFISGEVKNQGVVTIESNKRLSDAIDKLGGFTSEANLNKINLAMRIEDEKHYIIPKIGEEMSNEDVGDEKLVKNSAKTDETQKIDINTASIEELDTLPGIGEATANKIINHRDEKGKFKTVEEIKNVNGIGDKKYENIKSMIIVN